MPFKSPLFGGPRHRDQIIGCDFEAIDDPLEGSRRRGRNRKILQRDAPAFVVRQGVKNNLGYFAVEPADIQVGEMIDLPAHESAPEPVRPPEVVAGNHAMIDPFYCYCLGCHFDSSIVSDSNTTNFTYPIFVARR